MQGRHAVLLTGIGDSIGKWLAAEKTQWRCATNFFKAL